MDPDTGKIITEPNVNGELWVKGPRMEVTICSTFCIFISAHNVWNFLNFLVEVRVVLGETLDLKIMLKVAATREIVMVMSM